jgi:hypothetical protein
MVPGSDSNFIELARVESGEIIRQVNSTSYSQIDDYFAKRTFETNGDFVVKNFSLTASKNHAVLELTSTFLMLEVLHTFMVTEQKIKAH